MLGLVSVLAIAPFVQAPPPLRVAAVFNLSGSMADSEIPAWRGMRLAAEQINRSGGRKVELVLINPKSDPKRAGLLTEALLKKGHIDAVAGLYDSDYALAVGKAAQRHHVPFVTSGATLPGLTKMIGDYAFMACYNDIDQADAMAKFARLLLGAKTAVYQYDANHLYTKTIGPEFARAFRKDGGKIDFYKARLGQGDVMYLGMMPSAAGPAVKQVRRQGFSGPILSGDGFDTPDLAKVAGADARKVYFTTHVAFDEPNPRVRKFATEYADRYGIEPESASAPLAYDTLMLIADAAARQKRESLRDAIAATHGFLGVTGTISYSKTSREPHKPITVVQLVDGKTQFEMVLPPKE